MPFETRVSDRLVRGRIDAIFTDAPGGGIDVVDWKTGVPPTVGSRAERAVAVQLAAYRLAWAALAGVPLDQVRAAFYYVRENLTVRPADLLDAAGLADLIDSSLPSASTGALVAVQLSHEIPRRPRLAAQAVISSIGASLLLQRPGTELHRRGGEAVTATPERLRSHYLPGIELRQSLFAVVASGRNRCVHRDGLRPGSLGLGQACLIACTWRRLADQLAVGVVQAGLDASPSSGPGRPAGR